jgi:DNA-binding XRE family transcriptional regulator
MSKFKRFRIEMGLTQVELSLAAKIPRYKIQIAEQGVACFSADELAAINTVFAVKNLNLNWMSELLKGGSDEK